MKKLLSTAMALLISTSAMPIMNSNAVEYCSEYGKMTFCPEIIEYLDCTFYIYWDGTGYVYTLREGSMSFATMHMNLGSYLKISEEEFATLTEYISSNYPELTLDSENRRFIYKDVYTRDEMFDISVKIKEEFGFICDYYTLFDVRNVKILGDLSSDNALTPVDASMLLSYYADAQSGVAVASAESGVDYSIIGDFNGDGAVTPTDAAEILQYYADQQTGQ